MATCSSILAWKIAWMEEGAWRATVHGVPKSQTHTHTDIDQIRSVAQSCPTLCDPKNRSTPGLPVHHQLPEFTETHVHRVSDAIQPSHTDTHFLSSSMCWNALLNLSSQCFTPQSLNPQKPVLVWLPQLPACKLVPFFQ